MSSRLEELELDNTSLEEEIRLLQVQKTDLLKEIEKLKKKDASLSTFNQLKNLLKSKHIRTNTAKVAPSSVSGADGIDSETSKVNNSAKKRKISRYEDEYPLPEPVVHEFFDKSISKYFTKPPRRESTAEEQVIDKSQEKAIISENVLLENVYRLFGITAFPVIDPSSKRANMRNGSPLDLFGIRIEIFNEHLRRFETPHYIILSKVMKTGKWSIYKHTIPQFVQIEKWAERYDNLSDIQLIKFLKKIRDILSKTSLKHQIIEKLRSEYQSSKIITKLEKDLPLNVLKFTLKISPTSSTLMILNLNLENIESCFIERGFTETEKSRISNVLKGDIRGFPKRLNDVIKSVSS